MAERPAVPATPEVAYGARDLVRAGCLACHRIGPEGGGSGPDLTRVGAKLGGEPLASSFGEGSRHPALSDGRAIGSLDPATRTRIVAYLAMLR